jgi:predicted Zn finger-like uncharacterized protein
MAGTVPTRCPHCQASLGVAAARLGREGRCPRCGRAFTITPLVAGPSDASTPGPDRVDEAASPPRPEPRPATAPDGQAPTTRPAPSAGLPETIGRFLVREAVGAGGFGTVYRAYDPVLGREVALKVLHAGALATPRATERFAREARAAARLRHPRIVPIYEAGIDGPQPYLASAYVAGRTLAALVDEANERGEPIDPRRAAAIARDLAEALDHAHAQGIVHRDVKPANVMVDPEGQVHLMDFGLARLASSDERLTQEGAIVGTPAYVAPEQAVGGEATAASDQYGLGVTLYELLCGRTPFSGPPSILLFNLIHHPPPSPRQLNPAIPTDAEAICLKALAREPSGRYASCGALAEDLDRWLAGRRIQARPPGPMARAGRWCRRNRALAGSLAVSTASLLAMVVLVALYSGRPARLATGRATAAATVGGPPKGLDEQRGSSERSSLPARASQASREEAPATKDASTAASGDEREKKAAAILSSQPQLNLAEAKKATTSKAIDLRQERVALEVPRTASMRLSAAECFERGQAAFKKGEIKPEKYRHSGLKPDEQAAAEAAAFEKEEIKQGLLWMVETWRSAKVSGNSVWQRAARVNLAAWQRYCTGLKVISPDPKQHPFGHKLAFSPDGKTALIGGYPQVQFWDTSTWNPSGPPLKLSAAIERAVFGPDGKIVQLVGSRRSTERNKNSQGPGGKTVVVRQDTTFELLDASTGIRLGRPLEHLGEVDCHAISPNGKTVLIGSTYISSSGIDHAARLWDSTTGKPIGPTTIYRRGNETYAAGRDATTGKSFLVPITQSSRVSKAVFSPDGKTALTVSAGAHLWDTSTGRIVAWMEHTYAAYRGQIKPEDVVKDVAFSPDGKVIFGGAWKRAWVWDASTGKVVREFQGDNGGLGWGGEMSPSFDGTIVLVRSTWNAWLWDTATGQRLGPLIVPKDSWWQVALSPDGRTVLIDNDNTVRLWALSELPDDLARIATWIEVLTGMELDAQGSFHVLDDAAIQKRRALLERLGGPPQPTSGR